MSEYKPTEYVVDFGDGRSNSFVRLNMALLRENGSKLVERVVRCRDCKFRCLNECTRIDEGFKDYWFTIEPDGYCAWGERMEGSE